jgi:hypothetical protein
MLWTSRENRSLKEIRAQIISRDLPYPRRSAQIRGKKLWRAKTNAARTSHPSRIVRGFLRLASRR